MKKPTLIRFQKILKAKAGNISETAKALNVSRRCVYDWLEDDLTFKQAYDDQLESLIDFAESKLLSSINNGSDTATIFFLKTKGKVRGYVEKSEIDHTTKGDSLNKALSNMTDEELEQKLKELNAKMK